MKLLLTGAFNYSEEQFEELKLLGFDIVFVQNERAPLQIDVSEIEAVVCNGLFLYNDIKKFKKLKFIQLTSAGLDRVPLDYIKEKGISLCRARGVYSIPMAEWVVLKILEIYKKSRDFYEAQCVREWKKQRDLLELTDKTAAIIGFGDVGKEIAKRLKAFDVRVIGVGRSKVESGLIDEYYLIECIDEVLEKSDIVILTLPLTKETKNLIDSNLLARMKKNCIIINVSRGGIIDEVSLLEFLNNGIFLGAALDVFEQEPLSKDSQLWNSEKIIITPHNSFLSDRISERLYKTIWSNLEKVYMTYDK